MSKSILTIFNWNHRELDDGRFNVKWMDIELVFYDIIFDRTKDNRDLINFNFEF